MQSASELLHVINVCVAAPNMALPSYFALPLIFLMRATSWIVGGCIFLDGHSDRYEAIRVLLEILGHFCQGFP